MIAESILINGEQPKTAYEKLAVAGKSMMVCHDFLESVKTDDAFDGKVKRHLSICFTHIEEALLRLNEISRILLLIEVEEEGDTE